MYKITIEKTSTKTVVRKCEWAKIGDREIARDREYVQPGEQTTRLQDVYGYTPPIETTETVVQEIYSQTVDDLDIAAVLIAVNRLG